MSKVYLVHAKDTNMYKIGTSQDIDKRISAMQIGCPHKLILIKEIDGGIRRECHIHKKFKEHRKNGEWFEFDDTKIVISYMDRVQSKEHDGYEDALMEHKQHIISTLIWSEETEEISKHNLRWKNLGDVKKKEAHYAEGGINNLLELAIINIKLKKYDESIENIVEYLVHLNGRYSSNYHVKHVDMPYLRDDNVIDFKFEEGFFYDDQMLYNRKNGKYDGDI